MQGKEEIESGWYEPKPEWNIKHYRMALRYNIETDNLDAENKITAAFLESQECKGLSGPANKDRDQ